MLCDNCKLNNATKKCVMQTNFFEKETYLCSDCYERLYNKKIKVESDVFGNIFGTTFGGFKVVRDKVCDKCGLSLSQFEKSGVAGCENCYNVFSAEIESFIKKQQGKTIHIGKSPKKQNNSSDSSQKKQKKGD